jgi:polyferredoxin
MKNSQDENLSIAGDQSQALGLFKKIGIGLFLAGILVVFQSYLSKGNERYGYAMLSFGMMLFGAFFFTYRDGSFFKDAVFNANTSALRWLALFLSLFGFGILVSAIFGLSFFTPNTSLTFSFVSMILGIGLNTYSLYGKQTAGIKNNDVWTSSLTGKGIVGWAFGLFLSYFYIVLYWQDSPFPVLISFFDSLSMLFRGKMSDKWFVYGTLYTFVILFLGIKFMAKYRRNRYQLIRTTVVILSQLIFAYFIPNILEALSFNSASTLVDGKSVYQGYYNANPINSWPLNYEAFLPDRFNAYNNPVYQPIGMLYLILGLLMFLIITPLLTYLVGKRWYCSWICGCGGLAETAGDGFRHLSNKSVAAWKIERWLIHSIMVFVMLMTVAVMIPYFTGKEYGIGFMTVNSHFFFGFVSIIILGAFLFLYNQSKKRDHKNRYLVMGMIVLVIIFTLFIFSYIFGYNNAFLLESKSLKATYGFFVGAAFSGVIGVGFYPILGNRIWCRFGCPMAGYMGIIQRFKSRFRITTNGGQCISCGNCSTYCEQGIDVRAYAQKGQNIVRASCVGCGVCSAVCPRGVLKLENGPEEGRINDNPILIGKEGVSLQGAQSLEL